MDLIQDPNIMDLKKCKYKTITDAKNQLIGSFSGYETVVNLFLGCHDSLGGASFGSCLANRVLLIYKEARTVSLGFLSTIHHKD